MLDSWNYSAVMLYFVVTSGKVGCVSEYMVHRHSLCAMFVHEGT